MFGLSSCFSWLRRHGPALLHGVWQLTMCRSPKPEFQVMLLKIGKMTLIYKKMSGREAELSSLAPSYKTRSAEDEAHHWIGSLTRQGVIHGFFEPTPSPCRSLKKRVDCDCKGY